MPAEHTSLLTLIATIRAEASAIQATEPEEIRALRSGDLKIGTNNQYFTTWDHASGMIRDMSTGAWYPILLTLEDKTFTPEQVVTLAKRVDAPYSNYLRYSGFPKIGAFSAALIALLPRAGDRKEAVDAVRAYVAYLNRLASWSFHFFPWNLGEELRYTPPASVARPGSEPRRRVKVTHGIQIKLTWQPLNITVVAVLATNENPELTADFVGALPFTVLQDHAVVSGASIYAWAPLVSTAPVRVTERQCDAPVGRIRYSQATGNKIVVQYGEVTEDVETPVLGEISEEYGPELERVGAAVLGSTFETKDNIFLTVELVHVQER